MKKNEKKRNKKNPECQKGEESSFWGHVGRGEASFQRSRALVESERNVG